MKPDLDLEDQSYVYALVQPNFLPVPDIKKALQILNVKKLCN